MAAPLKRFEIEKYKLNIRKALTGLSIDDEAASGTHEFQRRLQNLKKVRKRRWEDDKGLYEFLKGVANLKTVTRVALEAGLDSKEEVIGQAHERIKLFSTDLIDTLLEDSVARASIDFVDELVAVIDVAEQGGIFYPTRAEGGPWAHAKQAFKPAEVGVDVGTDEDQLARAASALETSDVVGTGVPVAKDTFTPAVLKNAKEALEEIKKAQYERDVVTRIEAALRKAVEEKDIEALESGIEEAKKHSFPADKLSEFERYLDGLKKDAALVRLSEATATANIDHYDHLELAIADCDRYGCNPAEVRPAKDLLKKLKEEKEGLSRLREKLRVAMERREIAPLLAAIQECRQPDQLSLSEEELLPAKELLAELRAEQERRAAEAAARVKELEEAIVEVKHLCGRLSRGEDAEEEEYQALSSRLETAVDAVQADDVQDKHKQKIADGKEILERLQTLWADRAKAAQALSEACETNDRGTILEALKVAQAHHVSKSVCDEAQRLADALIAAEYDAELKRRTEALSVEDLDDFLKYIDEAEANGAQAASVEEARKKAQDIHERLAALKRVQESLELAMRECGLAELKAARDSVDEMGDVEGPGQQEDEEKKIQETLTTLTEALAACGGENAGEGVGYERLVEAVVKAELHPGVDSKLVKEGKDRLNALKQERDKSYEARTNLKSALQVRDIDLSTLKKALQSRELLGEDNDSSFQDLVDLLDNPPPTSRRATWAGAGGAPPPAPTGASRPSQGPPPVTLTRQPSMSRRPSLEMQPSIKEKSEGLQKQTDAEYKMSEMTCLGRELWDSFRQNQLTDEKFLDWQGKTKMVIVEARTARVEYMKIVEAQCLVNGLSLRRAEAAKAVKVLQEAQQLKDYAKLVAAVEEAKGKGVVQSEITPAEKLVAQLKVAHLDEELEDFARRARLADIDELERVISEGVAAGAKTERVEEAAVKFNKLNQLSKRLEALEGALKVCEGNVTPLGERIKEAEEMGLSEQDLSVAKTMYEDLQKTVAEEQVRQKKEMEEKYKRNQSGREEAIVKLQLLLRKSSPRAKVKEILAAIEWAKLRGVPDDQVSIKEAEKMVPRYQVLEAEERLTEAMDDATVDDFAFLTTAIDTAVSTGIAEAKINQARALFERLEVEKKSHDEIETALRSTMGSKKAGVLEGAIITATKHGFRRVALTEARRALQDMLLANEALQAVLDRAGPFDFEFIPEGVEVAKRDGASEDIIEEAETRYKHYKLGEQNREMVHGVIREAMATGEQKKMEEAIQFAIESHVSSPVVDECRHMVQELELEKVRIKVMKMLKDCIKMRSIDNLERELKRAYEVGVKDTELLQKAEARLQVLKDDLAQNKY